MKDFQTFKDMLDKANIEYEVSTYDDYDVISVSGGYVGFVSLITFKKEGSLDSIEAYE